MGRLFIPEVIVPIELRDKNKFKNCTWQDVIDIGTEVYYFKFYESKEKVRFATLTGTTERNILKDITTSIKKGVVVNLYITQSKEIRYSVNILNGDVVECDRGEIGVDMDDLNDKMIIELALLHRPH